MGKNALVRPAHHDSIMSMKPRISLVVTDLDNTLYDWVTFFGTAFSRMVDVAAKTLDISRDELLDDLRRVHRRFRNSEEPFALLETRAVLSRFDALTRAERAIRLDGAFHAFNSARQRTLMPYPGVLDTLRSLQQFGVRVVGHTDATITNAEFRIAKLGLDPMLNALYAVQHNGEPHPSPEGARTRGRSEGIELLRHEERKPSPDVLRRICSNEGVAPDRTLYVGDSLMADISMALTIGAATAWAKYGTEYEEQWWSVLVRISHFSDSEVEARAAARRLVGSITPDITLENFSDILQHFDFAAV